MARRYRNVAGPAIRKLRMKRGWTQDQLAAKLQLAGLESADRVCVAKIESQIRSVYDFDLVIIAHVLGAPAASLLPSQAALRPDLKALCLGEKVD